MESVYSDICELIKVINKLHADYSQKTIKADLLKINLSTKNVRDLFDDLGNIRINDLDYFLEHLKKFTKIDSLIPQSMQNFEYYVNYYSLSSRTKSKESLVNKLNIYCEKETGGRSAINKCLNDLFGLRVIIPDFNQEAHEFKSALENVKQDLSAETFRIKHIGKNSGYIATHVYFYGINNNRIIPWELQIWSSQHEKQNLLSHSIHKQDYTKWVDIKKREEFFSEK